MGCSPARTPSRDQPQKIDLVDPAVVVDVGTRAAHATVALERGGVSPVSVCEQDEQVGLPDDAVCVNVRGTVHLVPRDQEGRQVPDIDRSVVVEVARRGHRWTEGDRSGDIEAPGPKLPFEGWVQAVDVYRRVLDGGLDGGMGGLVGRSMGVLRSDECGGSGDERC